MLKADRKQAHYAQSDAENLLIRFDLPGIAEEDEKNERSENSPLLPGLVP